jgi:hypothetical protein
VEAGWDGRCTRIQALGGLAVRHGRGRAAAGVGRPPAGSADRDRRPGAGSGGGAGPAVGRGGAAGDPDRSRRGRQDPPGHRGGLHPGHGVRHGGLRPAGPGRERRSGGGHDRPGRRPGGERRDGRRRRGGTPADGNDAPDPGQRRAPAGRRAAAGRAPGRHPRPHGAGDQPGVAARVRRAAVPGATADASRPWPAAAGGHPRPVRGGPPVPGPSPGGASRIHRRRPERRRRGGDLPAVGRAPAGHRAGGGPSRHLPAACPARPARPPPGAADRRDP